jgi:succinoglycan biosynthesis protein ExoO
MEIPPPRQAISDDSVTVLIAAYNSGPFLHRAVRSALNQTWPPLEVLIIDDGSTDNTAEVAWKLRLADPRVQLLLLPENGGPARTRNAGLGVARGEWVAVLDADDAFLPERLERLTRAGRELNADIVVDNFAWYDAATDSVGSPGIPPSPVVKIIGKHEFVAQARPDTDQVDWGLLKPMFRRRFIDERNLRYPAFSRHGEDFLFMMDLLMAEGRYVLVQTPGYLYTSRASGMSRTRVDYDAMAAHTVDLLRRDPIRSDERLKRLLWRRVFAIRRLSAEHKLRSCRDARSYRRIARLMLADHWVAYAILRSGLRKSRGWIRERFGRKAVRC